MDEATELIKVLPMDHPLYGVGIRATLRDGDLELMPSQITFEDENGTEFGVLHFQNGPVGEMGVNGIGIGHLLRVAMTRLLSRQRSENACHENEMAILGVEQAIAWLKHRTEDCQRRGVEGTNEL